MEYRIARIPGDGIGSEVIPEGVRVLEALAAAYGFTTKFTDRVLEKISKVSGDR
jgi:tartrate dehydrogenase/decarboxylase/D-malate dehydrogenase